MNMVLIGPPGVGKGTVGHKIAVLLKIPYVSSGDLLRQAAEGSSKSSQDLKKFLSTGRLVPEAITNRVVEERLARQDCSKGYVLDGYPRNIVQLEAFQKYAKVDLVLCLTAPKNILIERISGRLTCRKCGAIYHEKFIKPRKPGICDIDGGELYKRDDQKPEAIKVRLETYEKETVPIIEYYRQQGMLQEIDASYPIEKADGIMQQVHKAIQR